MSTSSTEYLSTVGEYRLAILTEHVHPTHIRTNLKMNFSFEITTEVIVI